MTKTTLLLPLSAATLALALTACAQDGGGTGETTAPAPSTETTSAEATTDPTTDATTGSTTSDDVTAAGLAAIAAAEAETDGVAYAIDDVDRDGSWEVDVRTGSTAVEIRIAADGSVAGTENDELDADDIAALDTATLTLTEAIEIAVADAGGVLDDAELSDDDGSIHYEVSVDTDEATELDVLVDARTGDILDTRS